MVARIPGIAGPANFQRRLEEGLSRHGIEVSYDLHDLPYDAILVIGATRKLLDLWQMHRRGVPIVQRLNGLNWIHRHVGTGWRHYLRAELNNLLLRTIRSGLADHVVYQSNFAQGWWDRVYGKAAVESSVVYNAVPLDIYTPNGAQDRPQDRMVVLMVEGNLSGGYEVGLEMGVELARRLQQHHDLKVELHIAGNATEEVRSRWDPSMHPFVQWLGLVPIEKIPFLDRSAHLLYSSDPNPACPNAVIEALACGLPVVAFDTGALKEIVSKDAGKLAKYGGDPWSLEKPDMDALVDAATEVLKDQSRFREGARARAVEQFGLDRMVEGYLQVFRSIL
jgi:glycosyltransferase involved in cell wall biosynthesis